MGEDVSAIDPLEPELGGTPPDDQDRDHSAKKLIQIVHAPANQENATIGPRLKLKLYLGQTLFDLGQDATFLRQIPRDESDAEAQVVSGIVPGNGRNQLFRNQPLRDLFGSLEFQT